MTLVPTPNQRIEAMRIADEILVKALREGATRRPDWIGSEAHALRTSLVEASYRDGFPHAYPAAEVEAARALIVEVAS